MAQQNYLDKDGVLYLWQKLKGIFATKTEANGKVDKIEGKGLSTNDYTTAEKNKLAGVASGSQVNVIESIKRNGTALAVTDKAVDISVPTKTSDITNDSGYITISDVPDGAAASTTTPKMDGTATVGTETAFARGDHIHPSDTTRVPTSRKVAGHALTDDVTLVKGDVGLGNVDNTSDANKPISTAQQTALDGKVDKVTGKGLSTNDYTTAEKTKLAGIDEGAKRVTLDGTTLTGVYWGIADDDVTGIIVFNGANGHALSALTEESALSILNDKVDKVTGKDLSTNDYTTAEKTKLAGIATGAEVNQNAFSSANFVDNQDSDTSMRPFSLDAKSKTGSIQIRCGDNLFIDDYSTDNNSVTISAINTTYTNATTSQSGLMSSTDKTKLDAFGSASTYALKTDITGIYKYKGSVATVSALPSTDNITGDVYNVESSGMNYAWNGTEWDSLGEIFQITSITNAEIDTIIAS